MSIDENQLNLDAYTKLLIQRGVYKLYSLTEKGINYFAVMKNPTEFIILDEKGNPIKKADSLSSKTKELVTFENSNLTMSYNYNF